MNLSPEHFLQLFLGLGLIASLLANVALIVTRFRTQRVDARVLNDTQTRTMLTPDDTAMTKRECDRRHAEMAVQIHHEADSRKGIHERLGAVNATLERLDERTRKTNEELGAVFSRLGSVEKGLANVAGRMAGGNEA
jgi:hypothetical protein